MKHLSVWVVVIFALGNPIAEAAGVEKGTISLSGDGLSAGSSKDKVSFTGSSNRDDDSGADLDVSLNYYVFRNLALGATVGYGTHNIGRWTGASNTKIESSDYSFGGQLRFHLPLGQSAFHFVTDVSVFMGGGRESTFDVDTANTTVTGYDAFGYELALGFSQFIGQTLSLDYRLRINDVSQNIDGGAGQVTSTSSKMLFAIGFSWYLHK